MSDYDEVLDDGMGSGECNISQMNMDDMNDDYEYDADMYPVNVANTPWAEFLKEKGICSPDDVGNMPCDNGAVCDKCGAPWIQEAYELWLLGKADEREANGTL